MKRMMMLATMAAMITPLVIADPIPMGVTLTVNKISAVVSPWSNQLSGVTSESVFGVKRGVSVSVRSENPDTQAFLVTIRFKNSFGNTSTATQVVISHGQGWTAAFFALPINLQTIEISSLSVSELYAQESTELH